MSLDLEVLRKEALALCAPQFERIDTICLKNTEKVLKAYKDAQISSYQFAGTSGYGYSDMGREKLDEVFARVFKAEKPWSVPTSCREPTPWRRFYCPSFTRVIS